MKVVCIKECTYSVWWKRWPFSYLDYHFNIGDQFKLSLIQNSYYNYQNDPDKISIVIDFTDGKSYDVTVLKSDFITLEQWREQQLNQILEQ